MVPPSRNRTRRVQEESRVFIPGLFDFNVYYWGSEVRHLLVVYVCVLDEDERTSPLTEFLDLQLCSLQPQRSQRWLVR